MHIDNYPMFTPHPQVWVLAAPTISTNHFPKECLEDIEAAAVFANEEGIVLHLRDVSEGDRYSTIPLNHEEIATLDRFKVLGYTHVRFDRDGDIIEGLPTYTW